MQYVLALGLSCLYFVSLLEAGNAPFFTKEPAMAGKTCVESVKAFTKANVSSMVACASECKRESTCASFSYSNTTNTCEGCRLYLRCNETLNDDMANSVHYSRNTIIDYRYVGCFTLGNMTLYIGANYMTIDVCSSGCQAGQQYFGLWHGTVCFRGNETGVLGSSSDDCSMNCRGNLNQICGGANGTSVYECP